MRFTLHARKGFVVETIEEDGYPSMTHVITMPGAEAVGLKFGDEVEVALPTGNPYVADTVQRAKVVGLFADARG